MMVAQENQSDGRKSRLGVSVPGSVPRNREHMNGSCSREPRTHKGFLFPRIENTFRGASFHFRFQEPKTHMCSCSQEPRTHKVFVFLGTENT